LVERHIAARDEVLAMRRRWVQEVVNDSPSPQDNREAGVASAGITRHNEYRDDGFSEFAFCIRRENFRMKTPVVGGRGGIPASPVFGT
jgi:hypothetical protein